MEPHCVDCRSPKAETTCTSCEGAVCRKCRVFLEKTDFPVARDLLPTELKFGYFCGRCYSSEIEPIRLEYDSTLEQAKQIIIIFKDSKSTLRVLKKALHKISTSGIPDRDEAVLHLAFQAVKSGFNAVINTEVSFKKVRNEGYQTAVWEAHGLPAQVKSYEGDRDQV
jgi:uncharacterized protein YbjQ (UPF0145 family)